MTKDLTHAEMKRITKIVRDKHEQNHLDNSKQRFINITSKKMRTTMIGALSYFEKSFGHLWGHGKQDHELDEQEALWKEIWLDVREQILNNGHMQLRALLDELRQYTLKWNKYKTEFIICKGD